MPRKMNITLYTKPECHLCESVEQTLQRVQRSHPFTLSIRNILENDDDFARYQHEIPVVLLDGEEIARYRLSENELVDALTKK